MSGVKEGEEWLVGWLVVGGGGGGGGSGEKRWELLDCWCLQASYTLHMTNNNKVFGVRQQKAVERMRRVVRSGRRKAGDDAMPCHLPCLSVATRRPGSLVLLAPCTHP